MGSSLKLAAAENPPVTPIQKLFGLMQFSAVVTTFSGKEKGSSFWCDLIVFIEASGLASSQEGVSHNALRLEGPGRHSVRL